jgi:hypothetical protein
LYRLFFSTALASGEPYNSVIERSAFEAWALPSFVILVIFVVWTHGRLWAIPTLDEAKGSSPIDKTVPDLVGVLEQVLVGEDLVTENYSNGQPITPEGHVALIFVISIANNGKPSVITGWDCVAVLANSPKQIHGTVYAKTGSGTMLWFSGNGQESTNKDDWVQLKLGEQPIPTGGIRYGRLGCVLPKGVAPEMLSAKGTSFGIRFSNVRNEIYRIAGTWAAGMPSDARLRIAYPGMQTEVIPELDTTKEGIRGMHIYFGGTLDPEPWLR